MLAIIIYVYTSKYHAEQAETSKTSPQNDQPQAGTSTDTQPEEGATGGPSITITAAENEKGKELPFQLQVKYTDTEGAIALRVLTKTKPVTVDRKLAERGTNIVNFYLTSFLFTNISWVTNARKRYKSNQY